MRNVLIRWERTRSERKYDKEKDEEVLANRPLIYVSYALRKRDVFFGALCVWG